MRKTTFGVIVGNRGFFPDALAKQGRKNILDVLKKNGFNPSKTEWTTATKRGKPEASFHIYFETASKQTVELVVRSSEEAERRRKCEIFGDELKGLKIQELERVLKENPAQKFVPV